MNNLLLNLRSRLPFWIRRHIRWGKPIMKGVIVYPLMLSPGGFGQAKELMEAAHRQIAEALMVSSHLCHGHGKFTTWHEFEHQKFMNKWQQDGKDLAELRQRLDIVYQQLIHS